jgi:RNA polymerase sigma-70 factor (ECF subfamily)
MVILRESAAVSPEGAFDSLYESYHGKVFRVILRLVQNSSDAEDLTQETFLKAQKNLPNLKRPERVSSWLYRIASNTSLDFLRQSARRRDNGLALLPIENAETVPSKLPSPTAAFDTTETENCVQEYVNKLPDQYRVVIVLHDLEGLPLKQVAEVMGSSLGATKVRLHRARKRFGEICAIECEQFYNEDGIFSCHPKSSPQSVTTTISIDNACCGPDSPPCSCL